MNGLGHYRIKGAVPYLGQEPGFRPTKEMQRRAYEASQSVARLNAVFKKRREAWDAEAIGATITEANNEQN